MKMKNHRLILLALLACCLSGLANAATEQDASAVENGLYPANVFKGDKPWTLQERMQHYGVPGVEIAVIKDFKVAWYRSYGLADRETGQPVVATTLFQAGSVSKPVAAFGALRLVEAGKLSLDADVNTVLKSWKLPDNEFTASRKVTLRQLLSHTGGLTVHGFGGYAVGEEVPSVVQVLDGTGPANSDPVRVDKIPGESFRYSGGGYTIAQLMMTDVSGEAFAPLMDKLVIRPLGMRHSTYLQPLPPDWLEHAAAGVLPDGQAVPGKRHTYPEMAAAGLWTTASDLALFAIEMQNALRGESKLMSKEMAETMTRPVDSGYGLGWGIRQLGKSGYFSHGGWDEGFCSQLTAHLENGYGVVVMINANQPELMSEVVNAVAVAYQWDGYEPHEVVPLPAGWADKYTGRYRYDATISISITSEDGKMYMRYPGDKPEELLYTGDGLLLRRAHPTPITFTDGEHGPVFNFVVDGGERQPHRRLADDERLPGEILAEGSYEDALAAFRAALAADPGEESLTEQYLNNLGLNTLTEAPGYALGLLRINTDLYPASANTWDSLAFAYRQTGDREKAIRNYREALKRDPQFASALRGLAELEMEQ
jgi:CubicO group peptidase (beta-lactamase class C family)